VKVIAHETVRWQRWSITSRRALRVGVSFVVAVLAMSGVVAAQGRGRGAQKGVAAGSPTRNIGQPSTVPLTVQASPAFPQFGTWLDDATTVAAGAGYAWIGTTYWRGSNVTQINAPILGATYGISKRAHFSASIPFYRINYDGYSGGGLENVYISGKFALTTPDASAGGLGVAVGGVAEILSAGFGDGSRTHWALPVSVEFRAHAIRLYGSTGYFSRGAFFAAGAFEWMAPIGTSFTASLAHSQSVHGVTMATATVRDAVLREANVFVSQPISSAASVYIAGSRTFPTTLVNSASSLGGGLSFRFAGR
jgi:hypothetical protein